jgi:uncharacterized membrane protein
MNNKGSSIYDILVFSFADTHTADEVVNELKASQKLGGYKVVAEAVVIREADGSVHVHEPGEGGKGAAIGAVVGGAIGLLGGPVGVLWLAAAGGAIGGVAGHFAGRSIPEEDLKKIGEQLQPNSSAFLALVENTDAEAVVNSMSGVQANVVTITLGDELSGTIAQAVEADVTVSPQQAQQATTPATSESATPAASEGATSTPSEAATPTTSEASKETPKQ